MSDRTQDKKPFLGRGWSFPPSFGLGGREVEMVSGVENIHQGMQIVLGTRPGERVMQESFGCDLNVVMFEEMSRGMANTLEHLIRESIILHEPSAKVQEITIERDDKDAGCVFVNIYYTISGTNSRFNMVFPFYLTEAARPRV